MSNPWGVVGPGFPDVVAAIFQAGNTIINSGGLFIYNGAPGPATLQISLVGPGVTADPFATAVIPDGMTIFGTAAQKIFLGLTGGVSELEFLTGSGIELAPANVASAILGPAGNTQQLALFISGPRQSGAGFQDWVQIEQVSGNAAGTVPAEILFNYINNAQAVTAVFVVGPNGIRIANTAIPPGLGGGVALFSSLSGANLAFASGTDANIYTTGTQRRFLTSSQAGITTAGAVIATLSGATVVAGAYAVHGKIDFVLSGAGSTAFGFTGPAVGGGSKLFTNFTEEPGPGGTINTSVITGIPASITSPAYGATSGQFHFDGQLAFTAAGSLSITATPSAGTCNVGGGSYIELSPEF